MVKLTNKTEIRTTEELEFTFELKGGRWRETVLSSKKKDGKLQYSVSHPIIGSRRFKSGVKTFMLILPYKEGGYSVHFFGGSMIRKTLETLHLPETGLPDLRNY